MKPVDCPSTHWGGCGLQDCGDKNKHVSVIFYFKDVENSVYECVREKEIEREGMYVCITHKSHSLSTLIALQEICPRWQESTSCLEFLISGGEKTPKNIISAL